MSEGWKVKAKIMEFLGQSRQELDLVHKDYCELSEFCMSRGWEIQRFFTVCALAAEVVEDDEFRVAEQLMMEKFTE